MTASERQPAAVTTTTPDGLSVARHDDIAELIIDRPGKRNAISFEMWDALPGLLAGIDRDDAVKVLIVAGAGDHFSAGADISEFGARRSDPASARAYNERVERAGRALMLMRKPSIAVIRGFCIGGGCELALACDLRFADSTASMAITSAKLGIVYGFASTHRLVSAVGPSYAKYLLFSGNRVEAGEALRAGLVDQVFSEKELRKCAFQFARTVCSRSQVSVRGAKRIIHKITEGAATADEEAGGLPLAAIQSADYREGVRAFLEKRPARFVVR